MLHLSQMSFVGVCECVWVCAGVGKCAQVWQVCAGVGVSVRECVCETGVCRCAGKHRCARVCAWIYMGVYRMNIQNIYWRLDS